MAYGRKSLIVPTRIKSSVAYSMWNLIAEGGVAVVGALDIIVSTTLPGEGMAEPTAITVPRISIPLIILNDVVSGTKSNIHV